ncbi:MAG TPA: UMP kinase [archaeon]|nr:UMP kinase [archaeon]
MFDIFNQVQEPPQDDAVYSNEKKIPVGNVFVISVGGSLIVNETPNPEMLQKIANAVSSLHDSGKKIVLVVGGGKTARNYVEAFGSLNNFEKDLLGIQITRANAFLLASYIPNAHKEVLSEITHAKSILDSGKIPVFGGLMPFFTTDAVGALLAEYLGGSFINLTNVAGIYNADPKEFAEAKRFDEISYSRLVSMISDVGSMPGQNVVLDLACCMILQRSRIPAVVLDGNDTDNFSNYIRGFSFVGTVIKENAQEEISSEEIEELMPKKKPRKKKKSNASEKIKVYRDDEPFSARDINNLKL